MALTRSLMHRSATFLAHRASIQSRRPINARYIFSWFKKSPEATATQKPKPKEPVLSDDNLFHPFSKSPFPALRARGEAIQSLAACPVCASHHSPLHAHTQALPKAVSFECPDCGWPTHCSEEHWKEDLEHKKYCGRLREVNEDEHDQRRGRRMREYELPGQQDSEQAMSFANWDLFWYTRGFPSMDTERARRHSSKILTYPITIGSVLHQFSNLTVSNQRLTPEGSRSLAALRTTLHVPAGTPETEEASADKPQMRIFILGARHESSLPPHVWEQLTMLFPAALFHLYFIGPQVSLPKPPGSEPSSKPNPSAESSSSSEASAESSSLQNAEAEQEAVTKEEEKPAYLPNVYEPPTPAPIARLKRTRESLQEYGVPSYTVPFTPQLTVTGMQANYADVHPQFQETFDPYTDCFFLFQPGFGFPSTTSVSEITGEPLLQIASPTEWGAVIPSLLATKCPIFVTGFSPTDVERDVKALSQAPEVAGEFDWVVTPGPNAFGSEKWEVADFDPRVMVKTNWGIWAIRGKRRDIREAKSWF